MHMRDCVFGCCWSRENHVCGSAICVEGPVHGHFDAGYGAVGRKDFGEVRGEDVFGKFFYYDLCGVLGVSDCLDKT